MLTVSEQLTKMICLPDGRRRLGAISRVAERIGVVHSTVVFWMNGGKASPVNVKKIAALFSDKTFNPAKKKSGVAKGKTSWKFNERREHVYFKVS